MKILVTGATGFIGRQVLPLLLSGTFEVHATRHNSQWSCGQDVRWHGLDLLDQEDTIALINKIKPTHLLHLAWYAEPGKFWTSAENEVWVESSIAIATSFIANGGKRFVGAGTCAEYNWNVQPCSEEAQCAPHTIYGKAKLKAYETIADLCRKGDVNCSWGRIFWTYGPHEDERRLIPSVISNLIRRRSVDCTDGLQKRDFMHVQDVAEAFVRLIQSDLNGPVNIASGIPVSVQDVTRAIAQRLEGEKLLNFGALPKNPNEPDIVSADVTRLQRDLGFQPRYDLSTGLEATIAWWQEKLRAEIPT